MNETPPLAPTIAAAFEAVLAFLAALITGRQEWAGTTAPLGIQAADAVLRRHHSGPLIALRDLVQAAAAEAVSPPAVTGNALDRIPQHMRLAIIEVAQDHRNRAFHQTWSTFIGDDREARRVAAKLASAQAFDDVIARHVALADAQARLDNTAPSGRYRVVCSQHPEHAYVQIVAHGVRQVRICGVCGAVADFADDGSESSSRPVAEVETQAASYEHGLADGALDRPPFMPGSPRWEAATAAVDRVEAVHAIRRDPSAALEERDRLRGEVEAGKVLADGLREQLRQALRHAADDIAVVESERAALKSRLEALRALLYDVADDCDREAFDIREMVRAAREADDKAAQS